MNTIWKLILKEYRLFWSDRVAVSLTFLIPILLIIIWGSIFGNLGSRSPNLRLAFLNKSTSQAGKTIESVLDTSKTFRMVRSFKNDAGVEIPFDTTSIQEYVKKGSVSAALVIPEDAYTDTSIGVKLKFYYDPRNEMEMQLVQGMLQKTIMEQIPSFFLDGMRRKTVKLLGPDSGKAFNRQIALTVSKYFDVETTYVLNPPLALLDSAVSREGGSARNFFGNILQLDQIQLVGTDVANPWATRSVGGWAMMFLLFTVTASAASLFDEKKSGVVLRILASPISRVQILWSKYLYNISLGFIQLTVLFVAGALLFNIDILSNWYNLILIIVAASTACTAFGMLLSSISKTEAQARGMGTFLILAMSSVGGAWFPVSFMPEFIQTISKGTIVYWSMDGFLQVLWRGAPTMNILPNIAVLLSVATALIIISMYQFKKGHVF